MIDDPEEASRLVRSTYREAIRMRVDTDLPVGVVLSGGLDSSLTLLHVREMHPDCVAFTIGTEDSEDLAYARRLTADLGVRHEVVTLRPGDIGQADVREAIRVSEATEYGDIINAVVSLRLFQQVHRSGIKIVLTGDGSDELFGGYNMYRAIDRCAVPGAVPAQDQAPESHRAAAGRSHQHGQRGRGPGALPRPRHAHLGDAHPGVDEDPRRLREVDPARRVLRRPTRLHPATTQESHVPLQRTARTDPALPAAVRRMYRSFGYDAAGPIRRNFSDVLADCRHDLQRAVVAAESPRDYTAAEHARDFAGALKWNALGGLRAARRRLTQRARPGR